MVRTQIQLTEEQVQSLKQLAASRNISIAELIRRSVDTLLAREGIMDREEMHKRARAAAGRFHFGLRDLSERHDRYFAQSVDK